jgi:hypothetical protein
MPLRDLVAMLQMAIGPVILISGVGLLLLTMTNRFGRIIDRSRQLSSEARTAGPEDRKRLMAEIRILSRRSGIVRAAITFASMSVLLVAVLVIVLFLTAVFSLEIVVWISRLFTACMVSLIASLLLFLGDINLSLSALKLEIASVDGGEPSSHNAGAIPGPQSKQDHGKK